MADTEALSQRLELAIAAAKAAGEVTLRYFRNANLSVERKDDDSPVTIADREAELCLRQQISASFPDDSILGEEHPQKIGKSGYRWILDPIDGTKSFIHGVPLYGTLIAVERDGVPQIGVIRIPALDEMVYAKVGGGAWYVHADEAPVRAHVAQYGDLKDAGFVYSELANFDQTDTRPFFETLHSACRLCRTWGDCYAYLMVATGRLDIAVDALLNIWDAAALLPVIQEAGGLFCDFTGQQRIDGGNGIAANPQLIEKILPLVNGQSEK